MGTSGKSKRPPPQRDNRIDSTPPVPRQEAVGRAALRVTRPAKAEDELAEPAQGAALELDVARLKAERASDADEIGAMLVRLAAAERAREVAEQRARGLEKWTEELEAKVAEARTRGDDLEEELRKLRQAPALGAGPDAGGGRVGAAARDAIAKIIGTLEELERHESQSALARRRAFDQAREFLATHGRAPSRPPSTKDVPTVPPAKAPSKRPRRLSAAPHSSSVPTPTTPLTPLTLDPLSGPAPGPEAKAAPPTPAPAPDDVSHEMLTFEDLDLGD